MWDMKNIFHNIMKQIDTNNITVIGIDGLGGAGKSTISETLCKKFQDNHYHIILLHIDDFIHVREVRYNSAYPEWQCYYDLQWRFDYFSNVINEIKNSKKDYIDIELYDKDNDTYFLQRFAIQCNTIVIVEGVFLQRKEFNNIFDYMIYIDVPEKVRLQRVLKRDTYIGDEQQIIDKYENRYFPAERRYMEEYQPGNNGDMLLSEKGENMKLRNYRREDSATICSWIQDEKSLYQWSADRIGKFPLMGDDLNKDYEPVISSDRFIPLSAVDEMDNVVGHLFIRYPNETDNETVRFGYVIINPAIRGGGKGKEMLHLAIEYARNELNASKITLGVFANNDNARYCYEAVGFQPVGKIETYKMAIGEWECIEMELPLV